MQPEAACSYGSTSPSSAPELWNCYNVGGETEKNLLELSRRILRNSAQILATDIGGLLICSPGHSPGTSWHGELPKTEPSAHLWSLCTITAYTHWCCLPLHHTDRHLSYLVFYVSILILQRWQYTVRRRRGRDCHTACHCSKPWGVSF